MKVTITIDCNNAAFEPSASFELERILRQLAKHIGRTSMHDMNISDINGNTVGKLIITEED
jgi:hypothetical protein